MRWLSFRGLVGVHQHAHEIATSQDYEDEDLLGDNSEIIPGACTDEVVHDLIMDNMFDLSIDVCTHLA